MGWFSRRPVYPEPHPEGLDRAWFRAVGGQAAAAFLGEQDLQKAASIIEQPTISVAERFGEFHPDVGRSSLLLAVFQAILQNDEMAHMLSQSAKKVLEPLGEEDFDFRAAEEFESNLQGLLDGTFVKSPENALIGENCIGAFLSDLKPKR